MSLDVRAAALATGAGGLRGWAAKAQCGLYHTPADAFAGFHTGRTIAGGMEARWRVYEEDRRAMLAYLRALPPVPGRLPGPRPPRVDEPVADTLVFGDRAIR